MKVLFKPHISEIQNEVKITTSRGGGPGGQHVNKVNTKITLHWSIQLSSIVDYDQRVRIMDKLSKVINSDGEVVLSAHGSRSQLQNKKEVLDKLDKLLTKAFAIRKARKRTNPTKASVRRRLDNKKKLGEKKRQRRDPG